MPDGMSAFGGKADISNAHSNVRPPCMHVVFNIRAVDRNLLKPLSHGGLLSYSMQLSALFIQVSNESCVAIDSDIVG